MNMSNSISIVTALNELENEIIAKITNEVKCLFVNINRILNHFSQGKETDKVIPEISSIQKPTVKTSAICQKSYFEAPSDFESSFCGIKIEDLSGNNEFHGNIQQSQNIEFEAYNPENEKIANPLTVALKFAKCKDSIRPFSKLNSVYLCKQCSYATNYPGNLKRHQRFHDGIKKFKCKPCKTSFFTSHGLKWCLKTKKHNCNVTQNNKAP